MALMGGGLRIVILLTVATVAFVTACTSGETAPKFCQRAAAPHLTFGQRCRRGSAGHERQRRRYWRHSGGESRCGLNHQLHPNSYANAHSNAPANKQPIAHLDSWADEYVTAYSYPLSHCNTVADAVSEFLPLRQRRGGPHLRCEERQLRRLLG